MNGLNGMKTIFCDIDGTIFKHHGTLQEIQLLQPEILDGVIEKFNEWKLKSYTIILVTGRPESMREITNTHLETFGLYYDILIMGLNNGPRVVINDNKPHDRNIEDMAVGITIQRNEGIKNINV